MEIIEDIIDIKNNALNELTYLYDLIFNFLDDHPTIDNIVSNLILLFICGCIYSIVNILYQTTSLFLSSVILFTLYIILNIIPYFYIKYYSRDKIVDKNPQVLNNLDIHIPTDIYVYYAEDTRTEARFCSVNNIIEINSDILRDYKKDRVSKDRLEALLAHEIGHYNRRWKDNIIIHIKSILFILTVLLVVSLIQSTLIGSILISLLFTGFYYIDIVISRYKEKQADKQVYKDNNIKGLLELWSYNNNEDYIEIDYSRILSNHYPTPEERHLWIMQFTDKID